MSRRVAVALVGCVVVTGALATAGLVAVVEGAPGRFIAPQALTSHAPPPAPPTSQGESPHPSSDADTPWARISDAALTKTQYFAALNDPANSDFAPDLARQLSTLGADFVRADVTGDGRTAFRGYWGDGTDGACCRNVVVYAAGAERHLGRGDAADVAVIWSAERVGGGEVAETTTVVDFVCRGDRWQPLHPWELP
jgi:hypothetical protein